MIRNIFRPARHQAEMPRKLNIGCGYDKRPGFLNIDMDPVCKPDLLIVNNDLSILPRDYFDEIVACDVLEHIPRASMMAALLDWAALGRLGSVLNIQTSSMIGITEAMKANDNFEFQYNWTSLMFGNQMHSGDFHLNGFTERTLKVFLAVVGYDVDRLNVKDGWLFYASANKVRDWADLLRSVEKLSDIEFLRSAYSVIFRRQLDDEGKSVWLERLEVGTRYDVLKEITGSPEHLYKTAARLGL